MNRDATTPERQELHRCSLGPSTQPARTATCLHLVSGVTKQVRLLCRVGSSLPSHVLKPQQQNHNCVTAIFTETPKSQVPSELPSSATSTSPLLCFVVSTGEPLNLRFASLHRGHVFGFRFYAQRRLWDCVVSLRGALRTVTTTNTASTAVWS